jgi:hypothetical protein
LIWPIWRAQFPLEIWLTEGWNAYLQDAAIASRHLYPSPTGLVGNNYPPLSFYAVGLLGKSFGDCLYVGRTLSIVGLLCVAGEIFLSVRILASGIVGPAIGALWYIAIMSHNSSIYVGTNDPQLAGEAIMGAGLVCFLARDRDDRSTIPALLLMVVGGFWKHNMVAIPLTAVAWLWLHRGSKAMLPTLTSLAAVAAGLLLCGWLFGMDFFQDMLAPRAYRLSGIVTNIGHFQWSVPAFLISAIWAAANRETKPARFMSLLVGIGLASCLLQWCGEGVGENAEFDLILALGIATGITYARMELSPLAPYIRANYLRDIMVILLMLRFVTTERQETALLFISPEFRSYFDAGQREVLKEAADVSSISGDVYCSNKIVCRIAGKPFVVDDFKVEEMISTGMNTEEQISEILRARGIKVIQNGSSTRVLPDSSLWRFWRRARQ